MSKEYRIIHESGPYRIIEMPDEVVSIEDLEGDMFNPSVNPGISEKQLEQNRDAFHDTVNREGVFGYALERWDPAVGQGWIQVDSCWGFVGQYNPNDPDFNHYIVDELKGQIKE